MIITLSSLRSREIFFTRKIVEMERHCFSFSLFLSLCLSYPFSPSFCLSFSLFNYLSILFSCSFSCRYGSPNMVNSPAGDRCSLGRCDVTCIYLRTSHSARSVDRCARNIICSAVIGSAGLARWRADSAACYCRERAAARNYTTLPFLNQGAR